MDLHEYKKESNEANNNNTCENGLIINLTINIEISNGLHQLNIIAIRKNKLENIKEPKLDKEEDIGLIYLCHEVNKNDTIEQEEYHTIDLVHIEKNYNHIILILENKRIDYQNDHNIKYHQENNNNNNNTEKEQTNIKNENENKENNHPTK